MYNPVVMQWLVLAVRYCSLSLPLIANLAIPLSGMVGVAKSSVFTVAVKEARRWILPWIVFEISAGELEQNLLNAESAFRGIGLQYPIVGKPDMGCRGAGVKLLANRDDLARFIAAFPVGARL